MFTASDIYELHLEWLNLVTLLLELTITLRFLTVDMVLKISELPYWISFSYPRDSQVMNKILKNLAKKVNLNPSLSSHLVTKKQSVSTQSPQFSPDISI